MQHKRKYLLKKDVREHPKHVFSASRVTYPAVVDLRSKLPPVYDQGSLGSCTANALACAFEYDLITKKDATPNTPMYHSDFMPSRLFIYYNEREIENSIHDDCGASLEDGVHSLQNKGVCSENIWPYDVSKFDVHPPSAAYVSASSAKVVHYKKIDQNLVQLKEALSHGYPVTIGIQIFDAFESDAVAKTGLVPMPKKDENCLGGHAVLIVGYDDNKKLFTIRNSWGPGWGDKGYFYIPYAYVLDPNLSCDLWVLLDLEA